MELTMAENAALGKTFRVVNLVTLGMQSVTSVERVSFRTLRAFA